MVNTFSGDFHILMNYQPVFSKVYFDVGLKQVAAAGGFKGETQTSLQHCSNFKNTHYFLHDTGIYHFQSARLHRLGFTTRLLVSCGQTLYHTATSAKGLYLS